MAAPVGGQLVSTSRKPLDEKNEVNSFVELEGSRLVYDGLHTWVKSEQREYVRVRGIWIPTSTGSISVLRFPEYEVTAIGDQQITLPMGAISAVDVVVIEIGGYSRSLYPQDYVVVNGVLSTSMPGVDKSFRIGDKIVGYYTINTNSSSNQSTGNTQNDYVVEPLVELS